MLDFKIDQLSQAGNVIKITVKVADLFNSEYPPIGNTEIDNYTKLENGSISDYGDPKNTFSSDVTRNSAILWKIEFENKNEKKDYNLELVCIAEKKTSPYRFFDFDPLLPVRNLIIAIPKHGNPDNIYEYNIIFSITDNYRNSQTYAIDPQLRMT